MTEVDPEELSALRIIAAAAVAFIDAMSPEKQRTIVPPFERLENAVVVLRDAARLSQSPPAPAE